MADCAIEKMCFDTPARLALEAAFDGGRITSDGGLAFLEQAESEIGICEAMAGEMPEWRSGGVRHTLAALVKQRIFQIACGYEDQDDADFLRTDPLLKLVCGALPESGRDLASQPTICRMENAVDSGACYRMAKALGEIYIARRGAGGAPKKVLLDFDATDDPTHGDQEQSYYHGYFEQHMYHPLLVFDGDTGQLVSAVLRAGKAHGSHKALSILKRIVSSLRKAWPGVEIEIRADAGFAIPAIYEYCEAEGIDYTIALITNSRLQEIASTLLEEAKACYQQHQQKVRLLSEGHYRAGSWQSERRVIYKAEVMEEGTNTRFVVTNKADEPYKLYDRYTDRGEAENKIKDFKLALKSDRTSCHRFLANQFRLLLHSAAYWLLDTLRSRLLEAGIERMQLDTLRLKLVKVGGRVKELLTKVRLHLASGHPGQRLWDVLALQFAAGS